MIESERIGPSVNPELSNNTSSFETKEFPSITLSDGRLKFESWEHFAAEVESLESEVDQRETEFNAQFESQSTFTDIDLFEESSGYDDFLPLKDLENELGFSSKRIEIEALHDIWLDSPEQDFENHPYKIDGLTPALRTLVNANYEVEIEDEVVSLVLPCVPIPFTPCRCVNIENGEGIFGNLRTVSTGAYKSGLFSQILATSVSAYRLRSGRWRRSRQALKVSAGGSQSNYFSCNALENSAIGHVKGWKKTKTLTKTSIHVDVLQPKKIRRNQMSHSSWIDYNNANLVQFWHDWN